MLKHLMFVNPNIIGITGFNVLFDKHLITESEQDSTCVDLLEHKREQICYGISKKKDEIIKTAINHYLGEHDWLITDIIGRCNMAIFPDKTEMFQMDGISLVEIYPVMFKTEQRDGNTMLTAVQEYRRLTKEKEW